MQHLRAVGFTDYRQRLQQHAVEIEEEEEEEEEIDDKQDKVEDDEAEGEGEDVVEVEDKVQDEEEVKVELEEENEKEEEEEKEEEPYDEDLIASPSTRSSSITSSSTSPSCDLNCANGGQCEYAWSDEMVLEQEAMRGVMIQRCVCPTGYVGMGCEIALFNLNSNYCDDQSHNNGLQIDDYDDYAATVISSTSHVCDWCSVARAVSSFAGTMCRKPFTEYCGGGYYLEEEYDNDNGNGSDGQRGLSFCTNGGKCMSSILAAQKSPGDFTANLNLRHAGCICPRDFYGAHCEFLNTKKIFGGHGNEEEEDEEEDQVPTGDGTLQGVGMASTTEVTEPPHPQSTVTAPDNPAGSVAASGGSDSSTSSSTKTSVYLSISALVAGFAIAFVAYYVIRRIRALRRSKGWAENAGDLRGTRDRVDNTITDATSSAGDIGTVTVVTNQHQQEQGCYAQEISTQQAGSIMITKKRKLVRKIRKKKSSKSSKSSTRSDEHSANSLRYSDGNLKENLHIDPYCCYGDEESQQQQQQQQQGGVRTIAIRGCDDEEEIIVDSYQMEEDDDDEERDEVIIESIDEAIYFDEESQQQQQQQQQGGIRTSSIRGCDNEEEIIVDSYQIEEEDDDEERDEVIIESIDEAISWRYYKQAATRFLSGDEGEEPARTPPEANLSHNVIVNSLSRGEVAGVPVVDDLIDSSSTSRDSMTDNSSSLPSGIWDTTTTTADSEISGFSDAWGDNRGKAGN